MPAEFDALVAEALAEPTEGWNFARFGARMRSTHPSWRYWDLVAGAAASAPSLLDLGTGGGEQLAAFCERVAARPPLTVATESWPPNVPVAARRLAPLNIPVVHTEGAPHNGEQASDEYLGRLPFRDGAFALVIDRHEAFNPQEVGRVLGPHGVFVTQHVGSDYRDLHDLLDEPWTPGAPVDLALIARQVTAAGLTVEDSGEAEVVLSFADVGVLGWYLRQVPWAVPTVDVERDPGRWTGARAPAAVLAPCVQAVREDRVDEWWIHGRAPIHAPGEPDRAHRGDRVAPGGHLGPAAGLTVADTDGEIVTSTGQWSWTLQ